MSTDTSTLINLSQTNRTMSH